MNNTSRHISSNSNSNSSNNSSNNNNNINFFSSKNTSTIALRMLIARWTLCGMNSRSQVGSCATTMKW